MTVLEKLIRTLAESLPLDPKKFKVSHKIDSWPTKMIVEFLQQGVLRINEDLQRQYVWDETMASRYIESLMLGLPTPPIFVVKVGDIYYLVDGVQRVTTIRNFVEGKLRLTGVSVEELRNKSYKGLEKAWKTKFDTATVPVCIVEVHADEATAARVYLEIFRRLNLGGKKLNFTQVLFCSVPTPFIQKAKEIARSEDFEAVFKPTDSEKRSMKHYFISLSLMLAVAHGEPLNLAASYKQRYLSQMMKLIVEADEETANSIGSEVEAMVRLARDIELTREYFLPATYGIYRTGGGVKNLLSPILPQLILLALREIATRKEVDGKVVLEVPTDKKPVIRDTIKAFFRGDRRLPDGKTVREAYQEIVKNGKVPYLKTMYRELVDTLRLAVAGKK